MDARHFRNRPRSTERPPASSNCNADGWRVICYECQMTRTAMLVIGAVTATGMLTMVLVTQKCQAGKRANGAAGPEDAWWIDAPAGPTLVVSDRITASRSRGQRLVAVDVATGKRLATRVLKQEGAACSPANGGRLWCRFTNVELVDARTLATVSTLESALRTAGMPAAAGEVTALSDAAYAVTTDGRIARIDTASLAVTTVPTAPTHAASLSITYPTHASCALADDSLRPTATTLLEPRFIALGQVILAEHVTSLDAATARIKLARLDAKGLPAWDVEVGGRCQLVRENSGALVIATTNGRRRAHAIDLANGTVRWTLAFD